MSPLEVELSNMYWSVKDNDYYLRGAPIVEIRSDQSPLVQIFQKPLHELSERCLKIHLQLLDYNL